MLLLSLLLSAVAAPDDPAPGVVVAESLQGARVHLSPRSGLTLKRSPSAAPLSLGRGHSVRFDDDGRVWFHRDVDDGHRVLERTTWVLERGADVPRRAGERAPPPVAFVNPRPEGALLRIAIDPGHGGTDPGALGIGGLQEKDANLHVALRLRDLLIKDTADPSGGGAFDVLMTRSDDSTVSLGARVDLANAWLADRFVSIHSNAFGSPAANGTETYSFQEGTTAALLRDEIQAEMVAVWGLTDRGTKTAGFFVLVNTTMPATLSEMGFVTSPVDSVFLADPVELDRMALAHLFAIQSHFGLTPYDPVLPPATYCTGKTNSLGCVPFLEITGVASASSSDSFSVRARDVLPGQAGLLLYGFQKANLSFHGGRLCVKSPIVRLLPPKVAKTTGSPPCTGVLNRDFNARIQSGVDPALQVGQQVYAQWLQRDPADPTGFGDSLSDAVSFTVCP